MDTQTISKKVDEAFLKVVPTLQTDLRFNTPFINTLKQYMKDNEPLIEKFLEHAYLANEKPNYIGVWGVMDDHPGLKPVAKHSRRVATYVELMGVELGLNSTLIKQLKRAGRLHDIGKSFLPEEILYGKNFHKDSYNIRIVKQGHAILSDVMWNILGYKDEDVGSAVKYHHDVKDGYPHSKKIVDISGKSVQPVSLGNTQDRLVTLGDVADACVDDRTYQARMTPEQALERIKKLNDVFHVFEPNYLQALENVIIGKSEKVRGMYIEDNIHFAA